jgi:CxxC motif-containing protein (DUF1111 family)
MNNQQGWVPMRRGVVVFAAVLLLTIGFWMMRQSQSVRAQAQAEIACDPASGLGTCLPNLTDKEITLFNSGDQSFKRLWDPQQGLGPVFTQTQCNKCHGSPVDGGSSPTMRSTYFGKIGLDGKFDPLESEGGMLLQTFSVSQFKPACVLKGEHIPVDATIRVKRLPPPLFGLGLIDSIPDQSIVDQSNYELSIGMPNVVNWLQDWQGNTHVGKIGHKAQTVSLLEQSAGALQHDMGVTNPIDPNEDLPQGGPIPPNCQVNRPPPNDNGAQILAILHYLIYLAPAPPLTPPDGGLALFTSVGCDTCHHPTYTTGNQIVVPVVWNGEILHSQALSNQPVNLYSDLLVHDLGRSDGVTFPPGDISGSQFRTAPLWGTWVKLANGVPFLHDARTTDIRTVILQYHRGDATSSVNAFKALSVNDQNTLIAFVSSL